MIPAVGGYVAPLFSVILAVTQTYTILEVDQRTHFAGKYGQRVETRLRVQAAEGEKWVTMPRQHSRTGRVRTFQVGQTVTLP